MINDNQGIMNILITGIHGFVGENLVRSLGKRHSIYGVDIVAPEKEGVRRTFSWDELEGIGGMDAVIHLAGKAHDVKNETAAGEYFEVNTELTKRAFDYFLDSEAGKFVFFSSVKAVAAHVEGNELREDATPHPVGPYGESKRAAEEYIMGRMRECERRGKRAYILRCCMIHGPGNKGNLNLLYGMVRRGWPWPLGAFENRRSFAAVENVCFTVDGLVEGDVEAGIYHVADDEALSTNELVRVMCGAMGKRARIWRVNKAFVRACAQAGTWLGLPLNKERLEKLTEDFVVSNEKLKRALGVERMPVGAREGITRTIKSFMNE